MRNNSSNDDNYNDNLQVWVVFRTNAVGAQYSGSGVWIGLIAPSANPYYPQQYDYAASVALYEREETMESVTGAGQVQNPYGPETQEITDVMPLTTPEGYPVLVKQNGSVNDVFIQFSESHVAKYVKSSQAPSDYSTSNRPVTSFLVAHQETYEHRVALAKDTDFDGLSPTEEAACGINATNPDTDGDGIGDRVEYRACVDTDRDGLKDANDVDSDNDGVTDGLEDKNGNGELDAGETAALRADTDYDGLGDGAEDANRDGVRQGNETSPLSRDTDGDFLSDYDELKGTWCYSGEVPGASCGSETTARKLNATVNDTDSDGIPDGVEAEAAGAELALGLAAGFAYTGPKARTNPKVVDSDGDGLGDGVEDANRNGRVEGNETAADLWDSDRDGLCDGNCTGKGEDLNLNGVRDQDVDGNWTESDPLANDSDVDGLLDGWEVNGSWCNGIESPCTPGAGTNASRVTLALNPDTDGDGLRDGQETAGWKVLLWREITMESIRNYTVTSDPRQANNDGDANSDFVEFQNGSDPWATDTDGDGMNDTNESQSGGNVTGFYMQAPKFVPFVDMEVPGIGRIKDDGVLISKECRGGALSTFGCTPFAKVAFNVSSYWGVGWWEVRYGKPKVNATEEAEIRNVTGFEPFEAVLKCNLFRDEKAISNENCDKMREIVDHADIAGQTKGDHAAGAKNFTMYVEFQMTTAEDHWDGPFIQVDVFDIYGAGVQKTVKLKSTLDKVMDVLSAIAKVIMEAVSFLAAFFVGMIKAMIQPLLAVLEPLVQNVGREYAPLFAALGVPEFRSPPSDCSNGQDCDGFVDSAFSSVLITGPTAQVSMSLGIAIQGSEWIIFGILLFVPGGIAMAVSLGPVIKNLVSKAVTSLSKTMDDFIRNLAKPKIAGVALVSVVVGSLLGVLVPPTHPMANQVALGLTATAFIVMIVELVVNKQELKTVSAALDAIGAMDILGLILAIGGAALTIFSATTPTASPATAKLVAFLGVVISFIGWMLAMGSNSLIERATAIGLFDEVVGGVSLFAGILTFLQMP